MKYFIFSHNFLNGSKVWIEMGVSIYVTGHLNLAVALEVYEMREECQKLVIISIEDHLWKMCVVEFDSHETLNITVFIDVGLPHSILFTNCTHKKTNDTFDSCYKIMYKYYEFITTIYTWS